MGEHVARVGERRGACRIPNEKAHLEDLGVDRITILMRVLKKLFGRT